MTFMLGMILSDVLLDQLPYRGPVDHSSTEFGCFRQHDSHRHAVRKLTFPSERKTGKETVTQDAIVSPAQKFIIQASPHHNPYLEHNPGTDLLLGREAVYLPKARCLVFIRSSTHLKLLSKMQAYTAGMSKAKATEILAPPPRSGTFSVYAQKLTAFAFVWLCGIVVWGNSANAASVIKNCGVGCGFRISFAVFAWVYVSCLLLLNYFTENGTLDRTGCFSHGTEAQASAVLVLLFIPVVAASSTVKSDAPLVSTWFAWLGLFGSIYVTYKAYHSFKEEDLPSALPEGFDEEDYVYG